MLGFVLLTTNLQSQPQLTQPRMVIRPSAKRPVELAFAFLDRQIVDAGVAQFHQALRVELPVLVAVTSKPLAGIIVPFVGKTHGLSLIHI